MINGPVPGEHLENKQAFFQQKSSVDSSITKLYNGAPNLSGLGGGV